MDSIFKIASKNLIADFKATVNELARPENSDYLEEMVAQYGRIKNTVPGRQSRTVEHRHHIRLLRDLYPQVGMPF